MAPEALYNLDGGGSFKSIHDRHWPATDTANKDNTKKFGFANVDNVNSDDNSFWGSASRSSSASSESTSIVERSLPKDPSGGNDTSTSSIEEKGTLGATGGG